MDQYSKRVFPLVPIERNNISMKKDMLIGMVHCICTT